MSETAFTKRWSLDHSLFALSRLPALKRLRHPSAYSVGATVMTCVGAGTSLVAPMLLDPEAFGRFAVLATLFQLTSNADCGLSQLADQQLAAGASQSEMADSLLSSRSALGLCLAVLSLVILIGIGLTISGFDWLDPVLACLGGLGAMVAVGPLTVYRAQSRIFEFTVIALLLQAGMTAPRLFGLWFGGVSGCYGVLMIWYGSLLLVFGIGRVLQAPDLRHVRLILRALPLFLSATAFTCFLFAGRWIVVSVTNARDAGLFSFAASLVQIAVGTCATIGQVVYPRLLATRRDDGIAAGSRTIRVTLMKLVMPLAVMIGVALILTPSAVTLLFPKFRAAISCTLFLAPSLVPLAMATWLMPMMISVAKRPLLQSGIAFGPAVAILTVGLVWCSQTGGIAWMAMIGTSSALLATASLIAMSYRDHMLIGRDVMAMLITLVISVAVLFGEAFAIRALL